MFGAEMNYWAILVAAASSLAVGFIWYHEKVLGKEWMKLVGLKVETPEEKAAMKKKAGPAMTWSFVLSLVFAFVLSRFLGALYSPSFVTGIQTAVFIWVGFIGCPSLINYLFNQRSKKLWAIEYGYWLVVIVIMGAIIGAWR